MTKNLHEMFGLPDKKVDYKARLMASVRESCRKTIRASAG